MVAFSNYSWRRGFKDSRGQGFKGLFSKDFISAFNTISISAMFLFSVFADNNICVPNWQIEKEDM